MEEYDDEYDIWFYEIRCKCDYISKDKDPNGDYGCHKIGLCMFSDCPKREE